MDYYDYIRERKTKRKNPVYKFIKSLLLLLILSFCIIAGLVFLKVFSIDQLYEYFPFVPHKLYSITLSVNGKPKLCSASKLCTVSPSDMVQIVEVKTDGKLDYGIELYSAMFEVKKVLHEAHTFLNLCPQLSFEDPQIVEISAFWFKWNLGMIKVKIKWPARHWINKASSTKDLKRREYFLLKALKEEPDHPIARLKLAETYLKAGNFGNAAQEYEKIIKKGPSRSVFEKLIECYRRQNKKQMVIRTYLQAMKSFPDAHFAKSLILYLKKTFSPRRVKRIVEENLQEIPEELKPNFWLFLTDVCTRIKDWECVAKYSEKASKSVALGPVIKYNLGVAYFQKKKYLKALHYLSDYLKSKPDDVDALKLKAACYEKLKKWEEAEKIYRQLVRKNPSSELIALWIKTLQMMHNKEGLLNAYIYLTKVKPDSWTVWFNLGVLYFERNELEKALAALNRALNIKSSDVKTLSYLRKIYHKSGNFNKELDILDKLIKVQPANMEYYESYFEVARANNKMESIESIMRVCIKNLPEETKCYDMLLYALLKQKKKSDAVKALKKLFELQPENKDLLFQMAKLNYDIGHYEEALENLREYLKAKPDDKKGQDLYLQIRLKLIKLKKPKKSKNPR